MSSTIQGLVFTIRLLIAQLFIFYLSTLAMRSTRLAARTGSPKRVDARQACYILTSNLYNNEKI